jgi:hypothetical protein
VYPLGRHPACPGVSRLAVKSAVDSLILSPPWHLVQSVQSVHQTLLNPIPDLGCLRQWYNPLYPQQLHANIRVKKLLKPPMTVETHRQLANFIWDICNLLRGPYKRNEYRKVILPLTVLRRFDCLLAPTREQVLKEHARIKGKPETLVRSLLEKITGYPFYNLAPLILARCSMTPNKSPRD